MISTTTWFNIAILLLHDVSHTPTKNKFMMAIGYIAQQQKTREYCGRPNCKPNAKNHPQIVVAYFWFDHIIGGVSHG